VGCLLCQRACPVNKPYLKKTNEGAAFTEAETELMLGGFALEEMPPHLQKKLEANGLVDYYDPRNLRALLLK
jgi:epoxyqueuosine reductase